MLSVQSSPWAKLRSANDTATSFASLVATTTEPTGSGILTLGSGGGGLVPEKILLMPFGTGANDTTFDMRVTGWRAISTLWVPTTLYTFGCTLSQSVGVAGTSVVAADRFADTITLTSGHGDDNIDVVITSPANDTPGLIVALAKGFAKLQVTFDMTGATDGNALYAFL